MLFSSEDDFQPKSEEDSDESSAIRQQILSDENERLRNELQRLKAQFESAVEITKDMDSLHATNQELATKLRAAESSRDDLQRRIEINSSQFKEQLDREKEKCTSQIRMVQQQVMDIQNKMNQQKIEYGNKIEKLENELRITKQAKEDEIRNKKTLEMKINKILDTTSNMFNEKIDSEDKFQIIMQNIKAEHTRNIDERKREIDAISQEYESSMKQCTHKIKKLKNGKKRMTEQLAKAEDRIGDLEKEINQQNQQHQVEIKNMQLEAESKLAFDKNAVDQYEQKITRLQAQIVEKRKSQECLSPKIEKRIVQIEQTPKPHINFDDKKYEATISRLHHRTIKLNSEITEIKQKSEEMKRALDESKRLLTDYESVTAKQKEEIESLKSQNQSLETTNKSLQDDMIKSGQALKDEHNKIEQSLESKIDELDLQAQKLKKQNIEINQEKITCQQKLSSVELLLSKKSVEIKQLQNKIPELEKEVSDLRLKLSRVPPQLKEEDIVPSSSFRIHNAPEQVISSLIEISNNSALQAASKIQMALSSLNSYYQKITSKYEEEKSKYEDNNNLEKSITNELLGQLSTLFGTSQISVNEFYTNSRTRSDLYQDLCKYKDVAEKNQFEASKMHDAMNHIYDKAQLKSKGDINEFDEFINKFESMNNHLEDAEIRIKSLQKKHKDTKQKLNSRITELVEENEQLNSQNENLLNENKHKNKSIDQMKQQIKQLQFNIKDSDNNHMVELNEKQHELDTLTQELTLQNEENCKAFEKQILDQQNNINALNKKIHDLEETKDVLKKGVRVLKSKYDEGIEEIKNLKQTIVDQEKKHRERIEEERKNISQVCESTVAKLQEQCKDFRSTISKMNNSLINVETQNKKYSSEVSSLKRQNKNLQSELKSQTETLDREKKLMAAKLKSLSLATEKKAESSIQDVKDSFNRELNSLFAFISDEFRSYLDVSMQLDSSSIRTLITNVKQRLTNYQRETEAIRRLVGALHGQRTDDAVAQVLFSKSSNI